MDFRDGRRWGGRCWVDPRGAGRTATSFVRGGRGGARRTATSLSESGFAELRWIFGMAGDGVSDDGLIHGGQGELQHLLSAEGAEGRGELQLLCLNQDLQDCVGFSG